MEGQLEKIQFYDEEQGGFAEFFVIEKTRINGTEYLLAAQDMSGEEDEQAYVFKVKAENTPEGADMLLELVDDDTELNAVGKVFAELLSDDITIEM